MTTSDSLAYVTALGAIATPLIALAFAGIGWWLRSRIERRLSLENKLREDRVGTYLKILEPYAILLMSDAAWKSDPKRKGKDQTQVGMEKFTSLDYRHESFAWRY
jgi:hypothetical protein